MDPLSRYREEEMVKVMVGYPEQALPAKLKATGGRWNAMDKIGRFVTAPFAARSWNAGSSTIPDSLAGKCILNKMQIKHPEQDAYIPYKMPASQMDALPNLVHN
ncbi:hypothetical protein KP003_00355 [Geomonas nitrogeniifigens]|uniref:hypothetical protein n=1 Tax=Geomonas diazotrophica TaxID=2843197 RepID=UPI001C2BBDA9|nr:hypothetical protein [Geomonas nitrogeniifigens]QXE86895.1 hypothetical protein KP003_00355 [Geomonas nitrogeniifigens]